MDIDNISRKSGNRFTITITTPVAHVVPGTQTISGGDLTAGAGYASLDSNGYYDGTDYVFRDRVILETVESEGYYKVTASGKGTVDRSAIYKQITNSGFFMQDDEPQEMIPVDSLDSETAETSYYIKKSTISSEEITPTERIQTVTIGDGYYPTERTVIINPVPSASPVTSVSSINMAAYFYSANESDYDIKIIPQYTNDAGYVVAHDHATNGGTEYYKMKTTNVVKHNTVYDGLSITRGNATWNAGWIEEGVMGAAAFKNTPTAGKTYIDISNTSEAPVLISGDYLYIDSGYTDNLKISLAKLVPNSGSVNIGSNRILSGYSAYDNEGNLVTGTIPTYDGSYIVT